VSGFRVAKVLTFCYGHRIRGHGGPCAHVHGHTARVEVECRGPLDDLGMVVDFGEIGRAMREWVLANWDHRMVLEREDPLAATLRAAQEPVFLLDGAPTAENLARHLFGVARERGLPVTRVRFWESDSSMASYEEA
jgi:6-pyruvoyltetrahydropterin/6-carboxytetrahydropterin synthase